MGHREDLLEGAKRCLLEKGFVRTTARDIVKESGTNLASIGYHYGSKDALLVEGFIALIGPMAEDFAPARREGGAEKRGLERFQEVWTGILGSVPRSRPIWMLILEVITQGERLAGIRDLLVKAQGEGRSGLAAVLTGIDESVIPDDVVETEGRLYTTLLNGLMVQWLFDPETATTAEQLTEGLRRAMERMRDEAA
ncbi:MULTISPECIES: TetR/AcrR family transcriptional regulator [unclassified Streptomyces]|uniref:TetR/AcrR family transcriptional regulator n=1 Tax=unclassified Streptomyces TaxID=2593676 RepID=UPI00074ABF04|nr:MULTISPECIES: TetR/AcrR family transcriptional regulator [unclassified Streptomyces]KUL61532.1 TetR family transcriptional regulator [Streptomyces sp. NRRL S-1521]THC49653.1 TetR/AcrR family transcriptional regulator [Streptomyces sp. A1499]